MEPSPLTSVSLSWECLLVPLAAVSRPTWSKNQTGARRWGPEHPPPPLSGSTTSRGRCQATHTLSVAHGLWMFETLPHSLKATLWSPPVANHDRELQGSQGEQQSFGVGGGEGCEWGKGALVPWLRPGGGRQGPSPINDWVSQHQHSQHAAGIPAALSRPTDGLWCPHPPEARAWLQKRPVPSG